MKWFMAALLILFAGASFAATTIEPGSSEGTWEIVRVGTRPGVEVSYLLGQPSGPGPTALFLLFPGGDGSLPFEVNEDGKIILSDNFLVRSAPRFIQRGASVAIISPPSDKAHGLSCGFRLSEDHARDIRGVVDSLGGKGFEELFLTGTSNGTTSATCAGSRIKDSRIKGVVLTSSITATNRSKDSCYIGWDVPKITYPVLMVHNRNDGCKITPFAEALKLKDRVTTKAAFIEVRGGVNPTGGPCKALHFHGFIGREDQVVDAIVKWARNKPIPETIGDE